MNVLVVDDYREIAEIVSDLLVLRGIKTLIACNGEEALLFMEKHPGIQVVITDVEMPTMNGIELVEKLNRGNNKNLKILAMSGEPKYQSYFNAHGINFYPKPFDLDLMSKLINEVMGYVKKTNDYE